MTRNSNVEQRALAWCKEYIADALDINSINVATDISICDFGLGSMLVFGLYMGLRNELSISLPIEYVNPNWTLEHLSAAFSEPKISN